MGTYTKEAIERSKDDAEEWLSTNDEGWPRSWHAVLDEKMYPFDFEAPPIAGYEELEHEGKVRRVGEVLKGGFDLRVHFVKCVADSPEKAIEARVSETGAPKP